ncbi:MAG: hypothetical protein LUC34_02160, partial [Campylobacter sp.]|nr:hypothetical protein [Campylobacter sp.]
AGLGGIIDNAPAQQTINNNIDLNQAVNAGGARFLDDLGGSAVFGAGGKMLKAATPSLKKAMPYVAEYAGKAYDFLPTSKVASHVFTDNASGAKQALAKILGGDDEVLKANTKARQSLGDDAFNNFANSNASFSIPQTKSQKLNKGINYANDKILIPVQEGIKRIIQGKEKLSEQEADMLLTSLSHDNGAKIITQAIAEDPDAFEASSKILTNLNQNTAGAIKQELKDSTPAPQILERYEKRVKDEYAQVMKELGSIFDESVGVDLAKAKFDLLKAVKQGLPGASGYVKQISTLLTDNQGFNGLIKARNYISHDISQLGKIADTPSYDRIKILSEIKNQIDASVENLFAQYEKANPNLSVKASELLKTARSDYKAYKELEQSDLYKRLTSGFKNSDDLLNAMIKGADNQTGLNLQQALSTLNNKEAAQLESSLLNGLLDRYTKDGITDFKGLYEQIGKLPLSSDRALSIKAGLEQNLPILKNTGEILKSIRQMTPKTEELNQGPSTHVSSAIKTMRRNFLVNKLKSLIPMLGNNQALKNHIARALKNAGDLNIVIKNIDEIPLKNLDSDTVKALKVFRDEVIPHARQIVRQSKDDIGQNTLKGENFMMKKEGAAKTDYNVKVSIDDWVKELAQINNNELSANLFILQQKHPEFFKKPADVYRLLIEIKNNPTHFFKNNRPDMALIAKELNSGGLGKMAIGKENGIAGHITKSSNTNELKRLQESNKKQLGVGAPHPTLQRADDSQVGLTAGEKSHSLAFNENNLSKSPLNPAEFKTPNDYIKAVQAKGIELTDNKRIQLTKRWQEARNANKLFTQEDTSLNEALKELNKEYDVERFLNDRADIYATQIRYGNQLVQKGYINSYNNGKGWEWERIPTLTEKNYNSDFTISKKDVSRLRSGKADSELITKLKNDLEGGDYQGYDYNRKTKTVQEIENFTDEASRAIENERLKNIDGKDKSTDWAYISSHNLIGTGLLSGSIAGVERDKNGNVIGIDPMKFALGFLGGAAGTASFMKAQAFIAKNPQIKQIVKEQVTDALKDGWASAIKKYPALKSAELRHLIVSDEAVKNEIRGVYNVTYNGKNATRVFKDLENLKEALMFEKGNKNKGGKHIRIAHMEDESKEGYITKQELLKLGLSVRNFLAKYDPFIDKNGASLYEWSENGVNFRLVINKPAEAATHSRPPMPDEIITFYSDRNLKDGKKFEFKNPVLRKEAQTLPQMLKRYKNN